MRDGNGLLRIGQLDAKARHGVIRSETGNGPSAGTRKAPRSPTHRIPDLLRRIGAFACRLLSSNGVKVEARAQVGQVELRELEQMQRPRGRNRTRWRVFHCQGRRSGWIDDR